MTPNAPLFDGNEPAPIEIEQVQRRLGIPGTVAFEIGEGGLPCARLHTDSAQGEVYPHGAHVSAYRPQGQPDVMFMSERSDFAPGKPIRGGVPICFPWFAGHGDPPHGTARLQTWDVADTASEDGRASVELTTTVAPFELRYRVTVGPALELALRVENAGDAQASFELALHTYFAVADVRRIQIVGLEGRDYLDKTRDMARFTQQGPIRIEREVDRVYQHTTETCTLHDPGHDRRVIVEKQNAHSTIVWNPWTDKASRLPDMVDEEWQRFVCIESGNVHENAITLVPGAAHETRVRISTAPGANA